MSCYAPWTPAEPNETTHIVIPAKAGIQVLSEPYWIPALRYAAAGMTEKPKQH